MMLPDYSREPVYSKPWAGIPLLANTFLEDFSNPVCPNHIVSDDAMRPSTPWSCYTTPIRLL
jgi:hypothetical protein